MARRTAIIILTLILSLSSLAYSRKLTTTQMRENTIRINALELEKIDITEVIKDTPDKIDPTPDDVIVVMDERALHFDFDKSNVKPQYYEMLRKFIAFLDYNNYDVLIEGHTDSKGTDAYNMKLGQRRAESVKAKLIEFGLSPDRIAGTVSRGESMPVAANSTDEGRALNRRIEFICVGIADVFGSKRQ